MATIESAENPVGHLILNLCISHPNTLSILQVVMRIHCQVTTDTGLRCFNKQLQLLPYSYRPLTDSTMSTRPITGVHMLGRVYLSLAA